MARGSRPPSRRERTLDTRIRTIAKLSGWQRVSWLLAVLVPALIATAFATSIARRSDIDRQKNAFERRADEVVLDLRAGYEVPLEVVLSIPPLFSATARVDHVAWSTFVKPALARHRSIALLEWVPWLPHAQRASFEAAARAEGLGSFGVVEPDAAGVMRPAPVREGYWPLLYAEPLSNVALGLDIGFEPSRRTTFLPAIDTGQAVASARFALVEDPPDIKSIAVFAPVFEHDKPVRSIDERRAAFRGFVVGIFRLRDSTLHALEHANVEDLELALIDESAPEAERLLYETRSGVGAEAARAPYAVTRRFDVAQRKWAALIVPRPGVLRAGLATWLTLTAGILLSVSAAAFVGGTGAVRRLQRELEEARKLGQYHLVRKIGEGGMGAVYEAEHALLRRPTAVKLVSAGGGNKESTLARFEREVRVTSRLSNPHTIAIYDFGRTPKGVFYCAMEYLQGLNLEELIKHDGPQPAARVVALLTQVCASLAEAHAEGLVHRDVKPANIMVCVRGGEFDFVKVLDFGLVKESAAPSELSRAGEVLGTPLYMAPEAIGDARKVGPAADLYALGAVAYWMLTGSDVFRGSGVVELLAAHMSDKPEAPSARTDNEIPPKLESLVLQCLAKDPDERPVSALALAKALAACEVSPWTPAEAEQWWKDRGYALMEKVSTRKRPASSERTLQVARRDDAE